MINFIKNIFLFLFLFFSFFSVTFATNKKVNIFIFTRDDCAHCQAEKKFFKNTKIDNIKIIEIKIENSFEKQKFEKITKKYNIPKVTPITLIGDFVIIGFDNSENSGVEFLEKIKIAKKNNKFNLKIDYYLEKNNQKNIKKGGSTCDDENATQCTIVTQNKNEKIKVNLKKSVSFLGVKINFKDFSIFSLAMILGFVDGFNPCAMWVLLTFLIVLSQLKDRKKMFYLAGTFILAEGIMYFLILNFWTSTWNFIGYQKIVTFIIGIIAIFMGIYFIKKFYKNKKSLTCDITSIEYQNKITTKIKNIAKKPLTIISLISILFLAFSVNIIEFACSAGIPQTFTKILDINNLSFVTKQIYIVWYTFMYMVDDFVVFGLALWGYKNFYTFGSKYSNLSTLLAGIIILILGIFLIFSPNILIF